VLSSGYRSEAKADSVEVFGQVGVGLICDRIGRKTAMVGTTLLIVIGGILSTAASAPSELCLSAENRANG
jgi:hypothetical protein